MESGRPGIGLIHDNYKDSRYNYRRKLRQEKRAKLQNANAKLYENLVNKDSTRFWRAFKSLSQSKDPLPPQIDGFTGNEQITGRFTDVFSDIYEKNDTASHDALKAEFVCTFPAYYEKHLHDNISPYFFSWADIVDMVSSLKEGKAYAGFIKTEHVFHGSPKLMFHLHILFNAMLQHGYVPFLMLHGNITPLIKDRNGNVSDTSGYRAIITAILSLALSQECPPLTRFIV